MSWFFWQNVFFVKQCTKIIKTCKDCSKKNVNAASDRWSCSECDCAFNRWRCLKNDCEQDFDDVVCKLFSSFKENEVNDDKYFLSSLLINSFVFDELTMIISIDINSDNFSSLLNSISMSFKSFFKIFKILFFKNDSLIS